MEKCDVKEVVIIGEVYGPWGGVTVVRKCDSPQVMDRCVI